MERKNEVVEPNEWSVSRLAAMSIYIAAIRYQFGYRRHRSIRYQHCAGCDIPHISHIGRFYTAQHIISLLFSHSDTLWCCWPPLSLLIPNSPPHSPHHVSVLLLLHAVAQGGRLCRSLCPRFSLPRKVFACFQDFVLALLLSVSYVIAWLNYGWEPQQPTTEIAHSRFRARESIFSTLHYIKVAA